MKIIVKGGARVVVRFFSSEAGIPSGPLALWIFKLESKVVTPSLVTLISDISGKGWPLREGTSNVSSVVKTDVKYSLRTDTLSLHLLYIVPLTSSDATRQ